MNRKKFLKTAFLGFAGMGLLSSTAQAGMPSLWLPKDNIEPYCYNLNDPFFKDLLQTQTLPDTIKIRARRDSNKDSWFSGEGKGFGQDRGIIQAVDKYNAGRMTFFHLSSEAYTPVTLLTTNTHTVYGQYFSSPLGQMGIIRGSNGIFYPVHPAFRRVFTYEFECWGLPARAYEVDTCRYCKEKYVTQWFNRVCDHTNVRLMAYPSCARGGNHDGIPLKNFSPCHIKDDDIPMGAEF